MNVLQFICSTGFYGAERWVVALANHLDDQVVSSHLLATSENPDQPVEIMDHFPGSDAQMHRLEMQGRFDTSIVSRIVNLIQTHKIDIIHTHGYKSDLIGIMAARKAGIRSVSTPHGFGQNHSLKMRLYMKLGGYALRHFDSVSPLSRQLCKDMKSLGVPEHKVDYIANGVDMQDVELGQVARSTSAQDVFTFGYVGRLVLGKRLADTLKAFDTLWQSEPNCRLLIVGDGPDRDNLESQASLLKCGANVEFLGFRADRLRLMSDIDTFIMTSESEGVPRVLMEAMTMSIPVVAYDIPGVDELVIHEKTGLLAPLGDVPALVDCCRRIKSEPTDAVRLGAAGRRHIEESFSAVGMARSYTALYQKLIQQS